MTQYNRQRFLLIRIRPIWIAAQRQANGTTAQV